MKLILIYLTIFSALFFLVFMDHSAQTTYVPLKDGLLFSTDISSQTTLVDEITEKTVYKHDANYPTIEIYSTESLPARFLAQVTDSKDAKYKLLAAGSAEFRPEVPGNGQNPLKQAPKAAKQAPGRSKEQLKALIAVNTVKKEIPQETLNENKLQKIVNGSEHNYFFSNAEKTLADVTLSVKSVTPWQDKSIFTLEFNNATQRFFFVSNISVFSEGAPLPAQLFNTPIIKGGLKTTFFVITRQMNGETVSVKLSESAGGKRAFDIPVSIP